MIEQNGDKLTFKRNAIKKDTMSQHLMSLIFSYNSRTEKYGLDDNGSNGFFPAFQRDLVWTLEQKRNLIYSIMEGLPIGTFYINRGIFTKEGDLAIDEEKMELLDNIMYDGQQRFTTIQDFLAGKFTIEVDGNEYSIKDFDNTLYSHIESYLVSVVETNFDNYEELVDYYIKINRGGTMHTDEDIQKALSTIKQ